MSFRMPSSSPLRTAAAVLLLLSASLPPVAAPARADSVSLPVGASDSIKLGLKKTKIIELPRNARDIVISDPTVAAAVLRDQRRIFLTGMAVGQADLFVLDAGGDQILHLSLQVERDNSALQGLISRLVPDSKVRVEVINDNIVLSGSVKNAGDSQKAATIAAMFANGGQNSTAGQTAQLTATGAVASGGVVRQSSVTNLLSIEGEDQVQLKVSVVEMERTVAKQLGVDLSLQGSVGTLISANALSEAVAQATFDKAGSDFSATLNALESEGLARKLAEPTLTAISGESATFLAGGEFPVPTDYDATTNKVTYVFKQYGVSLAFTPVTLSEGRISLKVKTEVSELSDDGAVTISGVTIKSLKTRRAESTLELPSGGTLALGGLLQDDVSHTIQGTPGLKDLPILGALFRSRDFERKQTELVILVTPYIVRPTSRAALARPDDGYAPASEADTLLLGRLNKVYGKAGVPAPKGTYGGHYGYIFD